MQQDKTSKLLLQVAILGVVAIILGIALFRVTAVRSEQRTHAQIAQNKQPNSSYSHPKPEDRNLITPQDFLDEDKKDPVSLTENSGKVVPSNLPTAAHSSSVTTGGKNSVVTPLLLPGQNSQSYTPALGHNNKPSRMNPSKSAAVPSVPQTSLSHPTDTQNTNISSDFLPYMAAMNKEQAEALEKQLNGLSDRVEAAIIRALLPKSKKDANIEKYLSHNNSATSGQNTTNTGKFSDVANQMARQKADIMASMKQVFGNQAASEAGQLMNGYQNEIMQLLNQSDLTQEQIRQKARQISNKYNTKLQKLSEQNALQQMKEERLEKDRALQNDLEQSYGTDMADQLEDILDKYRQKDWQLAQRKDLTEEEYYKQIFDNQRQRHKELEQALIQNGKSPKGLLDAEDQLAAENLRQLQEQEEQGKIIPQVYRLSKEQKDALTNSIQTERADRIQAAQNLYGDKGAALIDSVYEAYTKEVNDIINDEHTSQIEKQRLLEDARQKINTSIEKIQNRADMKQLLENRQVESTLSDWLKEPELAQATPQQRKEFEEHARPILQQMYHRINEVLSDPILSDVQKQQQVQAIQREAQQQLGI